MSHAPLRVAAKHYSALLKLISVAHRVGRAQRDPLDKLSLQLLIREFPQILWEDISQDPF